MKTFFKSNDFSSNVHKSFQNLRKEEDFFDITLVGDDFKHVTAHKLVLLASSEYFKKIFSNNKKYFQSHALICLEGLNQTDLNNILDYIYHGEIQLYQHELSRFLAIAERLKLDGVVGVEQQDPQDDFKEEVILEENIEAPQNHLLAPESEVEQQNCEDDFSKEIILEDNIVEEVLQTDSFVPESEVVENTEDVQSSNSQSLEEFDMIEDSFTKIAPRYFKCKYCDKSYENVGHIRDHVENHVERDSLLCKFCDKKFSSWKSLRQHRWSKHPIITQGVRDKPYNTLIADQYSVIESLKDLDEKIRESYTKIAPECYRCKYCDISYRKSCYVREHVESHFRGLSFCCTLCDTIFGRRNALRNHIRKIHNKNNSLIGPLPGAAMSLKKSKLFISSKPLADEKRKRF